MITRLRLTNFKSFADATLNAGPFTVVVGANASGKSNIRDAFRFLHGIGRGYSIAEIVGGKYGPGGQPEWAQLRGAANEIARFGEDNFKIEVDLLALRRRYTYKIEIAADSKSRSGFRVISEELKSHYTKIFTSHPGGADPVDRQDDEAHLLLRMDKTGDQRKYGERVAVRPDQPALTQIADFQRVARSHKDAARAVADVLESMRFLDLVPEMMRKPAFPGQTTLGDFGENLPTVLQEICADPARKAILSEWITELTPLDVADFEFPRDQITGLVHLVIKEHNGQSVTAYSASDGTLRFLAMLAALLGSEPAALYFFEELDNGIHPSRLRLLLDLIETQTSKSTVQVITTTHSPELLSMISDETFDKTSVVYRLEEQPFAEITQIKDISNAAELRKSQGLSRLHSSGWFEDALAFLSPERREPAE